jgi:hypothetical protein
MVCVSCATGSASVGDRNCREGEAPAEPFFVWQSGSAEASLSR